MPFRDFDVDTMGKNLKYRFEPDEIRCSIMWSIKSSVYLVTRRDFLSDRPSSRRRLVNQRNRAVVVDV